MNEQSTPDGIQGNIYAIELMKKVARDRSGNPLVRKLALNILNYAQVPDHHFAQEALAIGKYVQQKVRYVRDPDNIEYLQDPLDLISQIQKGEAQGDCDDMALLTATLLLSIGHQPYFRAVRYQKYFGPYNHIYVVAYERNFRNPPERVVLDCILKDQEIGTEANHTNGNEYKI